MLKCLLVIVFVVGVENCPNRWALHDVDVWAHKLVSGRGLHHKSVNLYSLDNHEMLEVTRANVSVLCDGMIKYFHKLKYLSLIEANISKIQPGAFLQLPRLTHLSLAVNHLTSIERKQFENLANLTTLYLSKNQIENVDEDAFVDLIHLRRIYLDRNKLHEIDSQWFLQNHGLSSIDLSFNKISKLQGGAFNLPANSRINILLQGNEIEEVEPGAVVSAGKDEQEAYLILHLEHNRLTEVDSKFVNSMNTMRSNLIFDYNSINCFAPETLRLLKDVSVELHADRNPLSCDCLEAATNFVKDHALRATFTFSSTEECNLHPTTPFWLFPEN
jgi:hypothetical protein